MNHFTVKPNGTAKVTVKNPYVTMGNDNHSIFSNGGTALVIHAKADDMIACGEITK
jgi:superoxide dismutase, Cu-Zn family